MKKVVVLIFILIASYGNAQVKMAERKEFNPRTTKKVGYGFQFMGPTLFASCYMNYFINHHLNVEAGGGLLGVYGGVKLHVGNKERNQLVSPYIGINLGRISLPFSDFGFYGSQGSGWKGFFTVYLPVGIQLMNKNGYHFSVEGALMHYTGSSFTNTIPYGAMRFGKNF